MMNAIRRIATGALALVGLSLLAAGTSWSAPLGTPMRIASTLALTGPLASTALVIQQLNCWMMLRIMKTSRLRRVKNV